MIIRQSDSIFVRQAILYPKQAWEAGRVDKKFQNVKNNSELFDQDGDYDYYLTKYDEGGEPSNHNPPEGSHRTWAIHRPTGLVHGVMSWESSGRMIGKKGVITGISTHPDKRRQGIATTLFRKSQAMAPEYGISTPRHSRSDDRTPLGDLWVAGLGAEDWAEGEGR